MGNLDTKTEETTNTLLEDYTELRKEHNGTVLKDKKNENTYFLKEFIFATKKEFDLEMKRLEDTQSQDQNENVLPIYRISSQTFNSICSNSFKIFVIYEYPSITLEEEIVARKKENKYFDESELWSILQSCANAMSELKSCLSIHPQNIFIVPDGVLKVINNEMINEDYRCYVKKNVYYAPEKIRDFKKSDNENLIKKEGVFSLGMTLLHAALLRPLDDCYGYETFEFYNEKIESYIEELIGMRNTEGNPEANECNGYSGDFIELMAMILEPNPNKRASLMEVHAILNKVWNTEAEDEIETKQEYEPNESQSQFQCESVSQSQSKPSFSKNQSLNESIHHSINKQAEYVLEKSSNCNPKRDSSSNKKINLINQQNKNKNIISVQPFEKPSIPKLEEDSISIKTFNINCTNIESSIHQHHFPTTPQNCVPTNKENLYTDPKLLEMIRKDLYDLNELKKSSMISAYGGYSLGTSKYQSSYGDGIFSNKSSIVETNAQQVYNFKEESYSQRQNKSNSSIINEPLYQAQQNKEPNFSKNSNNAVYVVEEDDEERKYEGTIVNGVKEGFGKLTYSDGAYYEGYFKNGKMEGEGTLYYGPGRPAYQGSWLADQFHGFGILINETALDLNGNFNYNDFNLIEDFWTQYEGTFIDILGYFDCDNKSGEGKLILSNGEFFTGTFDSDFINGKGVFVTKDGEEVEGIWEDNVLVQLNA